MLINEYARSEQLGFFTIPRMNRSECQTSILYNIYIHSYTHRTVFSLPTERINSCNSNKLDVRCYLKEACSNHRKQTYPLFVPFDEGVYSRIEGTEVARKFSSRYFSSHSLQSFSEYLLIIANATRDPMFQIKLV